MLHSSSSTACLHVDQASAWLVPRKQRPSVIRSGRRAHWGELPKLYTALLENGSRLASLSIVFRLMYVAVAHVFVYAI